MIDGCRTCRSIVGRGAVLSQRGRQRDPDSVPRGHHRDGGSRLLAGADRCVGSSEQRTVPEWDRAMQGRNSYVALLDKQIVGFSDVDSEGYIDMMFVSPRHSRRGVASALLTHLHVHARAHGIRGLAADASITARPQASK